MHAGNTRETHEGSLGLFVSRYLCPQDLVWTKFSQLLLCDLSFKLLIFQASPVTWDPALANDAKKWANYLAANNLFQHDRNLRNQGENLYWSSKKPANPCIVATQRFYDEVKYYNFNKPGFSLRTGHFTQVRNFVSHEHSAAHLRQTRKSRTQESHHNFYGNHWLSIECSKGPKHNWRALS